VQTATTTDGRECLLLGVAGRSSVSRKPPLEEVAAAKAADVAGLSKGWTGRWILVLDGELHLDACGVLGCFYTTTTSAGSHDVWLSSSPAILRALVAADDAAPPATELVPGKRLDWYPPPLSGYPHMYRVLPSQSIDVATGRVSDRGLGISIVHDVPYDERLEDLKSRLVGSIQGIAELGAPLWIPLTGGLDSRLLLATARAADVHVKTYTYEKPRKVMSFGDRHLPPRVAAAAGVEHVMIPRSTFREERIKEFDMHTALHSAEVDRSYYAFGQWDALERPALLLRGGIFEVGRCYYWDKLSPCQPRSPKIIADEVVDGFKLHDLSPEGAHRRGIQLWAEWISREEDGLDWRDRFYIEQRVAGWLSSLEQGLDLTGYERIHIGNCGELIGTLLAFEPDVRRTGQHQFDLIRMMAPELARFPVNPPTPVSERIREELRMFRSADRKLAHVRHRSARLRARMGGRRAAGQEH